MFLLRQLIRILTWYVVNERESTRSCVILFLSFSAGLSMASSHEPNPQFFCYLLICQERESSGFCQCLSVVMKKRYFSLLFTAQGTG